MPNHLILPSKKINWNASMEMARMGCKNGKEMVDATLVFETTSACSIPTNKINYQNSQKLYKLKFLTV
jgi:hypothetical protein